MSAFFFRSLDVVFLHNPKTGGISIRDGVFRKTWCRGVDGPVLGKVPAEWPMNRSFGVVREPMDRFLSGLAYGLQRGKVKLELVQNISELIAKIQDPKNDNVVCRNGRVKAATDTGWMQHHLCLQSSPALQLSAAKILMRFESLEEDFQMVCRAFELEPAGPLPKLNVGLEKKPELSVADRKVVLNYLRPDYEIFGYEIP